MLYEWFASVFEQSFVYAANALTFTAGKDYAANLAGAFIHEMKTHNQMKLPNNDAALISSMA
jgi:hypothetical protein